MAVNAEMASLKTAVSASLAALVMSSRIRSTTLLVWSDGARAQGVAESFSSPCLPHLPWRPHRVHRR